MNLKLLNVIAAVGFLLAGTGCKKQDLPQKQIESRTTVNPALVYQKPVTPEEILLVENLGKVTTVFKELYKNNSNLKVVNGAIRAKSYTDESILLKDLIYPQNSRLSSNKEFTNYAANQNISLNAFAANFWNEANKRNDQPFKVFLEALKPAINLRSADGDEVTVYFPYSEAFEETQNLDESSGDRTSDPDTEDHESPGEPGGDMPITTLVTAAADADEALGYKPYYQDGRMQYKEVIVNDDYAYQNPTHIIGLNGVEPYDIPSQIGEAFLPENPIDLPDLHREVKQVYIGDVKSRRNYDAFISFTGNGGESEIRFTRADGYLKVLDGQVQADVHYLATGKNISRYAVKKGHFVSYSSEWDFDWEPLNLEQNLAIYEEDNRNSSTFNGTLTTTTNLSVPIPPVTIGNAITSTLGFMINFKSDDYIIKQQNYKRDVFFILNRTNLEGQMYNGWPVRDKDADVSFTLNDRTYY